MLKRGEKGKIETTVKGPAILNCNIELFPGIYLTDLTYLDTVHPTTGGLDKDRNQKVQNIMLNIHHRIKGWFLS